MFSPCKAETILKYSARYLIWVQPDYLFNPQKKDSLFPPWYFYVVVLNIPSCSCKYLSRPEHQTPAFQRCSIWLSFFSRMSNISIWKYEWKFRYWIYCSIIFTFIFLFLQSSKIWQLYSASKSLLLNYLSIAAKVWRTFRRECIQIGISN